MVKTKEAINYFYFYFSMFSGLAMVYFALFILK